MLRSRWLQSRPPGRLSPVRCQVCTDTLAVRLNTPCHAGAALASTAAALAGTVAAAHPEQVTRCAEALGQPTNTSVSARSGPLDRPESVVVAITPPGATALPWTCPCFVGAHARTRAGRGHVPLCLLCERAACPVDTSSACSSCWGRRRAGRANAPERPRAACHRCSPESCPAFGAAPAG